MKKYARLSFVLMLMVLLLCATTMVTAKTTLRFVNWASAEKVTRDQIENVIAAFEKANPDIEVESVPVPFGQIRQQVITMVAGGNAPDVIQVSSNMPFELAAMGSLEPVDNYASDQYLTDNWQAALKAGTYDGKLYAVPWGINYFGFWYNKKLTAKAGLDPNKPPKTWSQFLDYIEKAHNKLDDNIDTFELFTAKAQYGVTHNWSAVTIPIVLIFLLVQKYFIAGLTKNPAKNHLLLMKY